jgi:hypothetical protein
LLWCLRASKSSMQRRAAAILLALAWTIVCAVPLLAKPTRTLSRPAARLVTPQPRARTSRERTARNTPAVRKQSRLSPRQDSHLVSRRAATARGTSKVALTRADERSAHSSSHTRNRREALNAALAPRSRDSGAHRVHVRGHSQPAAEQSAARAAILASDRPMVAARVPTPRLPADASATGDESSTAAIDASMLSAAPDLTRMKSIAEEASTPVLLPPLRVSSLYDSRGRLIMPAPLYGSREILLHQNQMATRDGLDRVRDEMDLLDMLREKKLVALPTNETLVVDERLPDNRRYSRPWTAAFLAVLARDYYTSFHQPLQVTSAVRTVAVQQRLVRTNGNAAPVSGETASPHLTGEAIDIAKHGLSLAEIAWMRTYLGPLIDSGKIDVEEEFRQSCFHISVYKVYLPVVPHVTVAAARPSAPESSQERPTF